MNEYARVESFNAVLGDLNPRAQFKVEDVDTIAIKGIAPQYLKLPSGYKYNAQTKTITGCRGNDFKVVVQH